MTRVVRGVRSSVDQTRGAYAQTATGAPWFHEDPRSSEVDIGHIGHALSNLCRFTGSCREFYSVAQHSVLVAMLLQRDGYDRRVQFEGLLHDAHEAYMGDIAAPLKKAIPEIAAYEARLAPIVRAAFELPAETSPEVKRADLQALYIEHVFLMDNLYPGMWRFPEEISETKMMPLTAWTPEQACDIFSLHYNALK